jgi:hypothetical protein
MVNKIQEIYTGWFNLLTGKEKEQAKLKLETCLPCENNSTPNEIKLTSICQGCGCPLKAKTSNPNSKCPLNKF